MYESTEVSDENGTVDALSGAQKLALIPFYRVGLVDYKPVNKYMYIILICMIHITIHIIHYAKLLSKIK
jgi:hypothetical protein